MEISKLQPFDVVPHHQIPKYICRTNQFMFIYYVSNLGGLGSCLFRLCREVVGVWNWAKPVFERCLKVAWTWFGTKGIFDLSNHLHLYIRQAGLSCAELSSRLAGYENHLPVRLSSCEPVFLCACLPVSSSSCLAVFLWVHIPLRLSSYMRSYSCKIIFLWGFLPVRHLSISLCSKK